MCNPLGRLPCRSYTVCFSTHGCTVSRICGHRAALLGQWSPVDSSCSPSHLSWKMSPKENTTQGWFYTGAKSSQALAMSIDTGWSFLTSLTSAQRIRATSASLIRGWLHWGSSHLRDVACHAKSGWVREMGCIHNLTRPVSSYINYTTFSSRVVSVNSQAQCCMGRVLLQGLLRLSITCPGTKSLQEESFGLRRFIPID